MKTRLFTTDTDAGTVSVIDVSDNNLIATIPVGNAPRGAVKFNQKGRGYVSNCGGSTISEIDLFTNRELGKIEVGIAPRGIGITPNEKFALVSNSGSNTISIVDLEQRKEIHKINVGRDPRHMGITPDGRFAFVCIWGSQYISKILIDELNSETPKPDRISEVAQIFVGEDFHPYSLAIHPDRQLLYVANTQSRFMTVISYENDQVINQVDVGSKGGRAIALSGDKKIAFLTIENQNEVVFIDTDSNEIIKRVPTGAGPRGIAFDKITSSLYTANFIRSSGGGLVELNESVTCISFAGTFTDLKRSTSLELDSQVLFKDIKAGKGCCSVSLINID